MPIKNFMNHYPGTAGNLLLFRAVLLAGCAGLEPRRSESPPESDIASIRAVMSTYATGWNAQSPRQTIMSLFAGGVGNFVMIFRPVGGDWKIARYIWSDSVPRER